MQKITRTNKNLIDNTTQNWFESNPKKTSLIIFLVFLLLVELMVRLFFPDHLIEKKNVVPHKLFFKSYRNNIEFVTYSNKIDSFEPAINKINSLGIRGPELNEKSKYRVLNIGDSFIQADEVFFEDTFGERLNRSDLDIEFISHGIASWSPTLEFSWVYHNADEIQYDEVNLFLCINDFFRKGAYVNVDEFYRTYANYSETGIPLSYDITPFQKKTIRDIIKANIYIYKLMSFAKSRILSALPKSEAPYDEISVANQILMLSGGSETWDDKLKENVLETLDIVRKMHAFLQQRDITLNVLFVHMGLAWKDEFGSGKQALSDDWGKTMVVSQDGIEAFTKDYLERHKINYIDLSDKFDLFKKEHEEANLFYDMDGHWNKNGHRLVYQILESHYKSIR